MRSYALKRGQIKNIEGQKLFDMVKEHFGNAEKEEEKIAASFGALDRIVVWTDRKSLFIDTIMNKDVNDDTARETINIFNRFLEKSTGYTAKQRGKKAQKDAKG